MLDEPIPSVTRLNFLFEKIFSRALQVLEKGHVKCYIAERSQRKVFQVRGSRPSDHYIVFPRHYCSCQAFLYVVVGHDNPLCKHQLAARLAQALHRSHNITVSDEDMHDTAVFGRAHALTGMEKAQSLMPHPTMHMPSKTTVLLCVVVLHVVALSYLMRAAQKAQKAREAPRKVNCVYEWASLAIPRQNIRIPLGITKA
ncbi:hypothetical protein COCSUDRAFT_39546 [Coccomyxa subellipsoidea C-169]|uniref:SWIM-type domain-containing protein n=1 Tax=Coccomyxa subellipsoidea (strain C-169) TaxID=574566 RepID=I0Z731_COCSC|nr:hypothetical protein COCSUDRAFT_39546 [Coccomyxa subellipsoidea C-169]EIE26450.1 hypothetical protein COCSUDRAFT_39546 [Coccomyxa subellipsoidea C-169]|eukprot:XP_005650994.1 hypothetical protein COCSUDRAFT_39546 [Coccomyxa subellipsoidea C-169]